MIKDIKAKQELYDPKENGASPQSLIHELIQALHTTKRLYYAPWDPRAGKVLWYEGSHTRCLFFSDDFPYPRGITHPIACISWEEAQTESGEPPITRIRIWTEANLRSDPHNSGEADDRGYYAAPSPTLSIKTHEYTEPPGIEISTEGAMQTIEEATELIKESLALLAWLKEKQIPHPQDN